MANEVGGAEENASEPAFRAAVTSAKKLRTPQEKKRTSLQKDRRNGYGECVHAARKNIPLNKRFRSRAERHAANSFVQDEASVDTAQSNADRKHKTSWKKLPDAPLGIIIDAKLARRAALRLNPRKGKSCLDAS